VLNDIVLVFGFFNHLITNWELFGYFFHKRINRFVDCQENGLGILFWLFNFQKRMFMLCNILAFFAQIEVFTNGAFISYSDNGAHFTSITNIFFMYCLLLLHLFYNWFLTLQMFFNIVSNFGQQFVHFFMNQIFNEKLSSLSSKIFSLTKIRVLLNTIVLLLRLFNNWLKKLCKILFFRGITFLFDFRDLHRFLLNRHLKFNHLEFVQIFSRLK